MKTRTIIILMLLSTGLFLFFSWMTQNNDAPVQAIMSDWNGRLIIDEKSQRLHITMSGRIMNASMRQPVRIPLVKQGSVLRNVTLNGKKVSPIEYDNWLAVEFVRQRDFTIEADLLMTAENDLGEYSLQFQKPAFTSSILSLDTESALEFTVKGLTERIVTSPDSETQGSFVLGMQNRVELSWHETREVNVQSGTASVTPSIAWTIDESTLEANANLDVNIVGGSLDRLLLQFPDNTDNISITGRAVRDFRIDGNTAAIVFRGDIKGHTKLRTTFTVKRKSGDIVEFPLLNVKNGRTEAGGFEMVLCEAQGILLEHETDGFQHVSDLDINPELLGLAKGKPLYIYKRTSRTASAILDLVTSSPFPIVETIADEADVFCVTRANGEEITRIRYMVRNNSKQFLEIIMPAAADLMTVEVENKPCSVSGEGRTILVPLARSVQTLNGLVPFPVEIVFCRQGKPLRKGESRVIDLPELRDIPVASVRAEVLYPNAMQISAWVSSLQNVDTFRHNKIFQRDAAVGKDALAWNYYNAGYDAYRKNDLEQAEEFLEKAAELSGDSNLGTRARDLIGNTKAGRGEVNDSSSRLERAKVSSIQKTLSYQNTRLNAQQESLIDLGLKSIEAGDDEMGGELLEQAQQIETELVQRNASKSRQLAISKKYKGKLASINLERSKKVLLERKLSKLQAKNIRIAHSAGDSATDRTRASILASQLAKESDGLNQREIQQAAFGSGWNPSADAKESQVSQRAYASRTRNQVLSSGTVNGQAKGPQRKKKVSLEDQNRKLEQKVAKLESALDAVDKGEQTDLQQMDETQIAGVINEASRIETQLDKVIDKLQKDKSGDSTMYDVEAEENLSNLDNWATANSYTYGNLSTTAQSSFTKLMTKLKGAKEQITKNRTRRSRAKQVVLNFKDIVDDNAPAQQMALQNFISDNYIPQQDGDIQNFELSNGNVMVPNVNNNPEKINDLLNEFRRNDGNVVSVASRTAKVAQTDMPGIRSQLKDRTSDGRRYGVLDEAQYRTLLQGAVSQADGSEVLSNMKQKSIVVGTYNEVSGEAVKVTSSDADHNGISIGGQAVELDHDKYLVVDNGGSLSIIKAGAAHYWQTQGEEAIIAVNIPHRISLPRTGNSLKFEKTLLGAGESPDITLLF